MKNADKPIYPLVNKEGYPYMDSSFEEKHNNPPSRITTNGLTKREYASMLAMQGFLSNSNLQVNEMELIADDCVKMADALLKRLDSNP